MCIARLETDGVVCMETYAEYPQLGRFTLRDEGKTVAMGKVLKLVPLSESEGSSSSAAAAAAAAPAASNSAASSSSASASADAAADEEGADDMDQ